MPEKRWKAQERRVARLLGGKRSHAKGTAAADVETPWVSAEVKDRKCIPLWLTAAISQARSNAHSRQLPIAVITSPTARNPLVVLDLRDFQAWFGDIKKEEINA